MIDATALTEELIAAGLPVVGVSSDGRVDYSRERDERTARETAKTYYTGLNAYLNLTNPTQAQTVAALKAVIRILLWFLRHEFRT